jgi:hypothetical protein
MNTDETQKILDAVKSINIKNEQSQVTTNFTTDNSLYKSTLLEPVVQQMGSAYTAQNNLTVENIPHDKDERDIYEVDYSYVNTLKKPFYIKSFQVTSANTVGQNIFTLNLPSDYFAANHVLQNIGNTFKSFRGDFHLLVSVQGTPLASGALAAIVTYGGTGVGSYTSATSSLQNAYYRHHAILDYSDNSNTIDLIVPFRYLRNAIDPFLSAHSVRFSPIVPLAGQTSVTITISAFVENPVFRFLRPITAPTVARTTQGLINVTTINNTMRDIMDSTLPVNLTGDTVDINPSMMDDVPIPTNPTPFIVKYNSMNNANNPHAIERTTLISGAQRVSDKHTYGTTMDEMSIKSITQKDHFHTSFDVTTSSAVNSTLFATYVTPTVVWRTTANQVVTPLDKLTSYMKYWRGGLKFKFRFYMNRFQSIKLYAAMFYKDTEPTVLADFSTSHGVVLDIGGDQREVEIEIPYNAETAWLHCPIRMGQDFTLDTFQKYVLGKLALYTMTPLISPTGSPTSVSCHVTMSTSDDFEYASYMAATGFPHSIMLSSKSERTPNDIMDVVPSVKVAMKRYTKRSNYRQVFDIGERKLIANIINPMQTVSDYAAEGPWTDGEAEMYKPFYKELPLADLFNAVRGGYTIRIETTLGRNREEVSSTIYDWVPFCLYINGPQINAVASQYGPAIVRTLNQYYLSDWSDAISSPSTPYHIQPINPLTYKEGTTAVFEVDCSYLPVNKYALHNPAGTMQSHGLLVWGWYAPILHNEPNRQTVQVHSQLFQKISDDTRFGLAEKANFSIVAAPTWDAELIPVIA